MIDGGLFSVFICPSFSLEWSPSRDARTTCTTCLASTRHSFGVHRSADDTSTDDDPREREGDGTGGVVPKTRQASGKADGGWVRFIRVNGKGAQEWAMRLMCVVWPATKQTARTELEGFSPSSNLI